MRLIDADRIYDILLNAPYYDNADRDEIMLPVILNAPTVDSAPIKHGHWVSLTDCSNAGVYCSVCHKKVYKEDYTPCNRKNKLRSKYCPNCGAKMSEEEEGY